MRIVRRLLRAAWEPMRRLEERSQRRRLALSYYTPRLAAIDRWLFDSSETTNFTYDITDASRKYLAAALSLVCRCSVGEALSAIAEIDADEELSRHVTRALLAERGNARATSDTTARLGRRVGWYALVRLMKPSLVVETGVDKGLGACVLAAALRRNAAEGRPGRYLGTELRREAGFLFSGPYAEVGEIRYGDSLATLAVVPGPIDVFINDSDHSADYERREYEAIASKLSPSAVVVGDNAHCTQELFDFSQRSERQFLFWPEWPKDHWYPGAGIGFSFPRSGRASSE